MKNQLKTVLLIFIFVVSTMMLMSTVTVEAHEGHETGENECLGPTITLVISTADSGFAYDKTELKAAKGECVMIMFKNTQLFPHDFTIDKDGEVWTHLHLDSNTDNTTGPAPGVRMIHLLMPNKDITIEYYCSVDTHRQQGMVGNLVIGAGSEEDGLPGFGFYITIFTFTALLITFPRNKIKYNN